MNDSDFDGDDGFVDIFQLFNSEKDNIDDESVDSEENDIDQMEYNENFEDIIGESCVGSSKEGKEYIKPINKLKGKKKTVPVYMGNILHKDTNTYEEYNV